MLELVVFLCGALTMVLEVVNTRALAPYFGTSTVVWTNIIGAILASLSLGYYLGGRLSRTKRSRTALAFLLLGAGVCCALIFAGNGWISAGVVARFHDIRIGSLISSVVLFAPLNIILGMVMPYISRIKIENVSTSGETVGNLSALSALGSIIGTFSASLFFLPRFGNQHLYLICAFILVILSFAVGRRKMLALRLAAAAIFILAVFLFYRRSLVQSSIIKDIDTSYNRILVYTAPLWGKEARLLVTGRYVISALFVDGGIYAQPYFHYFDSAATLNPDIKRILMIGGGGLAYKRNFLANYPHATMDVVEIDPDLPRIAQADFGYRPDRRIRVIGEDGRVYLNHAKEKYDAIFIDAFNDQSVPFQLTTKEAVAKMSGLLSPDGVIVLNLISALDGKKSDFARNELATYKGAFPSVELFALHDPKNRTVVQNIMLVAAKNTMTVNLPGKATVTAGRQLTDDFAPVEYYALDYRR